LRVGLIDYGAGNQTGVRNALEHIGATPLVVRTPNDLEQATHLVLPGVGAFKHTMHLLHERGLDEAIRLQVAQKNKPLLGICVGMQVLAREGHEFESSAGLGLIDATVEKIDVCNTEARLPHIGWNDVSVSRSCPLLDGLEHPTFYFAHSYRMLTEDDSNSMASCDYGTGVTAVVQKGNVFGVQFHPEKSQHDGLQILRNFVRWAA